MCNEMHHRAKKLFSFRVSCADSRLPKNHRMPRAKNVPFGNPLLQTSRGSFYAHFSLFPLVQKSNLTRVLTDKRNIISCFICLYRCSYSLDREIIGETDNKCDIGAESPPIAYRKNLMTIYIERTDNGQFLSENSTVSNLQFYSKTNLIFNRKHISACFQRFVK